MATGLPTSTTNTGFGATVTGGTGVISAGSAAATPPKTTNTPVPQPTPTTPTTVSGTSGSAPALSSYYPTAPAVSTYAATNATAGTAGTAPVAAASDVNGMAGITANGQINPNDPTNSASQLDAITNADSPYIQLAKQQGLLSAGARGLENSSIGAGASEAAAVGAAAPLAEQNASTAASGQLQNSQLNTQANEFNASQQNSNNQLNAQLTTQTNQFNAGQITAAAAGNAAAANAVKAQTEALIGQMNNTALSSQGAATLANIQGQWQSMIGSNQAAASLYSNYLNGISTLMNNTNIAPSKMTSYFQEMTATFNSAMTVMNAINGGSKAPTNMTAPG